jgi:hypothetical protein
MLDADEGREWNEQSDIDCWLGVVIDCCCDCRWLLVRGFGLVDIGQYC